MTDELELLGELPRHQPSDALRRQVRVAAIDRLAESAPARWWERGVWRLALDQLAIPLALAALSIVCLAQAASHTPLLR